MKQAGIVLVAPCILNASLQVGVSDNENHWGIIFVQTLKKEQIEIFPLPCTESEYCGLLRKKHGIDFYQSLEGDCDYCRMLAQKTADEVYDIICNGYELLACLGVEHSPSCAVSYLYSQHGTLKRQGIFFEFLFYELEKRKLNFEQIGINGKYPGKAYIQLTKLISQKGEIKHDDNV